MILDNSSTHGTEVQAWLGAHPQVHFHYTPTSASWLNEVEGFFGILGEAVAQSHRLPEQARATRPLGAYMRLETLPTPFEWTKPARAIIRTHRKMLNRISAAVH